MSDDPALAALAEALRAPGVFSQSVELTDGHLSAVMHSAAEVAPMLLAALHAAGWTVAPAQVVADAERYRALTDDAGNVKRNHYDWFFPKDAPRELPEEWLAATEAKMTEALGDPFVDDAAQIMLVLIAEVRRLRPLVADGEALARLPRPYGIQALPTVGAVEGRFTVYLRDEEGRLLVARDGPTIAAAVEAALAALEARS